MDRQSIDAANPVAVAQRGDAPFYQIGRKQSAATVRAVVRGERPLSDLARVGISVSDPVAYAEEFLGVTIWSADLAEGIMNLKGDGAALFEWAGFVLNAAELFGYAPQDVQCCERLMSYIWQIPFGTGLSNRAITLATMVRNWPRQAA